MRDRNRNYEKHDYLGKVIIISGVFDTALIFVNSPYKIKEF